MIGIKTERIEGVDVAIAKRPVKALQRTTNLIRSAIPEMLSPQHTGIVAFSVEETGVSDEGFIVIDIPSSPERPHYSNVHHQYFRRGSNGTRVLEHGEIRELMAVFRHGDLEVRTSAQHTMSTIGRLGFNIILSLANIGGVPIRAPYIKISPGGWHAATNAVLDPRLFQGGTVGLYAKTDQLVHVQDVFHMASKATVINFRSSTTVEPRAFMSEIRKTKNADMFFIQYDVSTAADQVFGELEISFGAENVAPKTTKLYMGKWEMFEILAQSFIGQS